MNRFGYIIFIAAMISAACGRTKVEKEGDASGMTDAPLAVFCDTLDYTDTAALHERGYMKYVMKEMVKMLPKTDSVVADKALAKFFGEISTDDKAIETVAEFADLYLNNPASPVRDADMYIRVVNAMLGVDSLPEGVRFTAEEKLRIASLNRPGSIATDFEFIDRTGCRRMLHNVDAQELMLIFYDPECPHCNDILKRIASDSRINYAIANGVLTILAIYAEGKKDVWEKSCDDLPANWSVGFDMSGILENGLYDLPAMPIIYLLGSDKRVMLKDPEVTSILM